MSILGATDLAAMIADLAGAGGTVTVAFSPDGEPGSEIATAQVAELLERTMSGETAPIDLSAYAGTIRFLLAAGAAVSGTEPTLHVEVLHCATEDGEYELVPDGAFALITDTASVQALEFEIADLEGFGKIVWTIDGEDDPAFQFAVALQATPIVEGSVYSTPGLLDREVTELLGGEGGGVAAADDVVHVQTGTLPGLEVGSAITIDGAPRKVHAMQPYEDGAMTRILLRAS